MFVIVEYLGTWRTQIINTRERVSVKPKPILLVDHQSSMLLGSLSNVTRCGFRKDNHSWKTTTNATKNWMRHPGRIVNTGGARTLNERGMCRHSLFLLPGD